MHNGKQGSYAFILFLVWPFLAAVTAFKNYRKPWAKNIFWLFCIFYGFTFAIGAESQGSDIVRAVERVQELHSVEMSFARAIEYFQQSGEIDVLRTAIAIGLSRLTDSQPVFTMVLAVIFGFFFSRNLWYIMDRLEGKIFPITIILLSCFFLVNPIWNINGFRMWTAVHIFLFGLLPYLCEGKTKYLWVSVLSMAVHFSMLVPVGVLFGYIMAGNRLNLYFGTFIFTAFFAELDIGAFNNLMEAYAPEILQERTSSYRQEDPSGGGGGGSSRVWYAVWYGRALQYSIIALLIGLFVTGREFFSRNRSWMNLYCFTLLFYSAANVLSSLSSGSRFFVIANLCALALITLYIQNIPREKVMKRFVMAVTPGFLFYFVVAFRIGLYSMSATSILGNPVIAYFMYEEFMSMNDFLKSLL
ncbi:EpsG family protein [Rhodohalobacter sp. 8-1]|uniref:EpsG family protein n=1 Tax=Rhodohalobacter sp. 8-1 TaxID=3131972 RepID=UPI0030EDAAA0